VVSLVCRTAITESIQVWYEYLVGAHSPAEQAQFPVTDFPCSLSSSKMAATDAELP